MILSGHILPSSEFQGFTGPLQVLGRHFRDSQLSGREGLGRVVYSNPLIGWLNIFHSQPSSTHLNTTSWNEKLITWMETCNHQISFLCQVKVLYVHLLVSFWHSGTTWKNLILKTWDGLPIMLQRHLFSWRKKSPAIQLKSFLTHFESPSIIWLYS